MSAVAKNSADQDLSDPIRSALQAHGVYELQSEEIIEAALWPLMAIVAARVAQAEKRGAVRELLKVVEYLNAKAGTAAPEAADALRTVTENVAARAVRIESGEVTL